jgi:hypothetical protein
MQSTAKGRWSEEGGGTMKDRSLGKWLLSYSRCLLSVNGEGWGEEGAGLNGSNATFATTSLAAQ